MATRVLVLLWLVFLAQRVKFALGSVGTPAPTFSPSLSSTRAPTSSPTLQPSLAPTLSPSSSSPSNSPTSSPSILFTTVSFLPTEFPFDIPREYWPIVVSIAVSVSATITAGFLAEAFTTPVHQYGKVNDLEGAAPVTQESSCSCKSEELSCWKGRSEEVGDGADLLLDRLRENSGSSKTNCGCYKSIDNDNLEETEMNEERWYLYTRARPAYTSDFGTCSYTNRVCCRRYSFLELLRSALGITVLISRGSVCILSSVLLYDLLLRMLAEREQFMNPDSLEYLRIEGPVVLPQNLSAWLGDTFVLSAEVPFDDRCPLEGCLGNSTVVNDLHGPFTAHFVTYVSWTDEFSFLFISAAVIGVSYTLVDFAIGLVTHLTIPCKPRRFWGFRRLKKCRKWANSKLVLFKWLLSSLLFVAVVLIYLAQLRDDYEEWLGWIHPKLTSRIQVINAFGWVVDHGSNSTFRVQASSVELLADRFGTTRLQSQDLDSSWCTQDESLFDSVQAATERFIDLNATVCFSGQVKFFESTNCVQTICPRILKLNSLDWVNRHRSETLDVYLTEIAGFGAFLLLAHIVFMAAFYVIVVFIARYYRKRRFEKQTKWSENRIVITGASIELLPWTSRDNNTTNCKTFYRLTADGREPFIYKLEETPCESAKRYVAMLQNTRIPRDLFEQGFRYQKIPKFPTWRRKKYDNVANALGDIYALGGFMGMLSVRERTDLRTSMMSLYMDEDFLLRHPHKIGLWMDSVVKYLRSFGEEHSAIFFQNPSTPSMADENFYVEVNEWGEIVPMLTVPM